MARSSQKEAALSARRIRASKSALKSASERRLECLRFWRLSTNLPPFPETSRGLSRRVNVAHPAEGTDVDLAVAGRDPEGDDVGLASQHRHFLRQQSSPRNDRRASSAGLVAQYHEGHELVIAGNRVPFGVPVGKLEGVCHEVVTGGLAYTVVQGHQCPGSFDCGTTVSRQRDEAVEAVVSTLRGGCTRGLAQSDDLPPTDRVTDRDGRIGVEVIPATACAALILAFALSIRRLT